MGLFSLKLSAEVSSFWLRMNYILSYVKCMGLTGIFSLTLSIFSKKYIFMISQIGSLLIFFHRTLTLMWGTLKFFNVYGRSKILNTSCLLKWP